MTAQFIRKCSLIIGNVGADAIDCSELHIQFETHRADVSTPAWARIRIYNLSQATERQIQDEFTSVWLQAGYVGNQALIFSGNMIQKRSGRENATDTFLEIIAADGDIPYNFAVVNKTLAAGWTQYDLLTACAESFAKYGVALGHVPELSPVPHPRGRACYGMARDLMRELARDANASWKINNGILDIIRIAEPLPGEAQAVNAASGMIGVPQQTIDGITVRCLLNPAIKFGGLIKLNNADVQAAVDSPAYSALNYFPGADDDGLYKVISISHIGDTRGGESSPWYCDLITVANNGTAPLSGPYITATASKTGY